MTTTHEWKKVKKGTAQSWGGNGFGYSRDSAIYGLFVDGVLVATVKNLSKGNYREPSWWEVRRTSDDQCIGGGWKLVDAKATAEKKLVNK